MKALWRGAKVFLVIAAAVLLTTLSIDATDALRGSQSALGILTREVTEGGCAAGMREVEYPDRSKFCIDTYEVSTGNRCPYAQPQTSIETAGNANDGACLPVSETGKVPWTHVAKQQAQQLCARAGKRLPTAEEWYLAAAGTPDHTDMCNISGQLAMTGSMTSCVSGAGAFDMVGNVWEWVEGDVQGRKYIDTELPAEGYVAAVGTDGVPSETTSTPQVVYNDDYFWSEPEGEHQIMRGGFHGSRTDAGIYSVHAGVLTNFESAAVGFRCVQSL